MVCADAVSVAQVDKDTMEMLKTIGMGNLPGVTVPSVRCCGLYSVVPHLHHLPCT